jgi:hypothetical protein
LINAYTSPTRNGATTGSSNAVMGFDDELYGVMFGGAASANPVLTMFKVDGDVIRTSSFSLPSTNAVVNGWEAIVTSPTTALMVYGDSGTGGAPWAIRCVRLDVAKNDAGASPTASESSTALTSAAYSAAAYSIMAARDETNPNKVCVTALTTGGAVEAFIVSGAVSGSVVLGSPFTFDSAPSSANSQAFNQTPLTKGLRSVGTDAWLFAYVGTSNFARVARITASDITASVTVTNLHGKNPGNIYSLGPNINSNTVFATAHGTATTSYSGVFTFALSAGVMEFKEFAPVQHNILFTTVRTHCHWTTDGWVIVTGGLTSTATAVLAQHNQFAIFKVSPAGVPVYHGTYGLPINTNIGTIFNPQSAQAGRIKDSFVSTSYNFAQNIPFRISLDIEFIKV